MLGSSANYHNMRIFFTADASLAVEPLYPQVRTHLLTRDTEPTFFFVGSGSDHFQKSALDPAPGSD